MVASGKAPRCRRRWPVVVAVVTVAVLVVGVLQWKGVVSLPFMGKNGKPGVFQVDSKGGTYKLPTGGQVTVPKGAVDKPTMLTVTAPRALESGDAAPLSGVRQGGVAFDVSLSRGNVRDIQPAKNRPLVLTLPINPPKAQGKARMFALAYTAMPGGKYVLLPSRVAGTNQLNVQLPHLSAKYVTYVTDEELLEAFDPEPVKSSKGKNCPQNVTISGIKVKIDPAQNRGWSPKKADSAIFACLAASKDNAGYVRLNVANMIGYILAVKSGDNMRLASSRGGLEEELDKYVAKHMPGSGDIKLFLGRGGKLVGSIDANSLYESGAKIELWADANAFWAESAIKVVGLLVGLLTGEGDAGKTLKVVNAALHVKDVIGCVEDAAESSADDRSALKFGKALFGCFGAIAEAIGEYVDPLNLLWKFGWAVDAAKVVIEQTLSLINGGKLQMAGTLRAVVMAEPPPCPSGSQLHQVVQVGVNRPGAFEGGDQPRPRTYTWGEHLECRGLWAYGGTNISLHGPTDPQATNTSYILHFDSNQWQMVEEGQDMGGSKYCTNGQAPAYVREWLSCYDR